MNAYIAFTIASACIVVIAAIGCYYLGRRSRNDEVNALNLRNAFHEKAIGEHIAYEDRIEQDLADYQASTDKALAVAADDLAREQDCNTYLREQLDLRTLGAVPFYSRVKAIEPPPIPDDYLAYDGSPEGQTGAWSIPREVMDAVELGIAVRGMREQAEQDIEPCHLCSDICADAEEFLGRYPHLGLGMQGERNPCRLCGTDQDSLDEVYAFFAAMALEPEYAEIVDEVSTP